MSNYFEDNFGFDLRDAIQGAIDDEDVDYEEGGIVAFYTTDGDVTFDFNDKTVSFEGDVVDFDDCDKAAIALAREVLAKYEPAAAVTVSEAKKIPETYAEAFAEVAAKSNLNKGCQDSKPNFSIEGPAQLTYKQTSAGPDRYYTYNFLARVLVVSTSSAESGSAVMPFSKLDRESLEAMRDKLVELGGTPPPLAPTDAERFNVPKFRTKGPGNV